MWRGLHPDRDTLANFRATFLVESEDWFVQILMLAKAYQLSTEIGHAIYRLRKCTVEPVIGIIKEILASRQFSLRGLKKVIGEWCLVCLAFNLKRLHIL